MSGSSFLFGIFVLFGGGIWGLVSEREEEVGGGVRVPVFFVLDS